MRFVWDPEKNRRNLAKHKVSFELASRVFEDPHHLSKLDFFEGEERWQTLGLVHGLVVLLIVHTVTEDEEIRIVSARKATRSERKAYEQAR